MQRIFILGAIIYLLLVLALATTHGTLMALMLPFLIYLGIGFFFSPEQLDLAITRELSADRAYPGDAIQVRITVTNHGSSLDLVKIEEQLPEGLAILEGEQNLLKALSSGESVELAYTVSGPRGFYHFRGVQISASDTLQVRTKTIQISTDERLFIQPQPQRMGRLEIRPRRTRVYAGYIPTRLGGTGVEFFGVREYQQGDPLRFVNWRASARHHQKFFINEFEQERVADVGLILDTRQRSEVVAQGGESLFEFSVQAAAALAESFLNAGNRVGLLMYGTLLDWTLPDYGKLQRERIMQRLATARPGESLVFDNLQNLPTRLLPPKSQVVFISPLQEGDLSVLITLRARGYAVMVISPNPIVFELKCASEIDKDMKMAARLAGLERMLMMSKLQQAGIQMLDWHIEAPLNLAVAGALSRPGAFSSLSIG